MKEWDVNLKTKSGNLMTVHMSGYDFADDAIRAAMAQTDAEQYISCSFVGDTARYKRNQDEYDEPVRYTSSPSFDFHYESPRELTEEELLRKKPLATELWNFCVVAWIPTIILMLIHVGLGVGFAVAFGIWWFKDPT